MSENVTGINFTKDPGKDAFIRVKKDQITSDKPIWELAKDLFGLTDEKQIDAVEDAIIEFNNEKVQEEGYRGTVLSEDTKDLEGIIYIPSAGDVLDIEKIEHNDNDEIIKEEEPLQDVEETDKTDESEDIAGSAGIKDTEETDEVSDTDKVDETDEVNESDEVEETEETEETDEVDEAEETEEATEDKGEKFGFFEGLGAFAKGIFTKGVTNLAKAAFEHPLLTGGVTALAIIGCANPITGPFVLAGLGIAGIFGAVNALKNGMENAEEASDYYAEGEYDKAKESLEDAGGDAFNLGISAFGSFKAFQAASKAASATKAATSLVDDGLNAADDGLNAADDGLNAADDGLNAADDGLNAADDGLNAADTTQPKPITHKNAALSDAVKSNKPLTKGDAYDILKPTKSANGTYSRKHIDSAYQKALKKFGSDPQMKAKIDEAYTLLTKKPETPVA